MILVLYTICSIKGSHRVGSLSCHRAGSQLKISRLVIAGGDVKLWGAAQSDLSVNDTLTPMKIFQKYDFL